MYVTCELSILACWAGVRGIFCWHQHAPKHQVMLKWCMKTKVTIEKESTVSTSPVLHAVTRVLHAVTRVRTYVRPGLLWCFQTQHIQEHTVSVTTVFPDFLVVVLQDLPPEPVWSGAHSDTDCVRMYIRTCTAMSNRARAEPLTSGHPFKHLPASDNTLNRNCYVTTCFTSHHTCHDPQIGNQATRRMATHWLPWRSQKAM